MQSKVLTLRKWNSLNIFKIQQNSRILTIFINSGFSIYRFNICANFHWNLSTRYGDIAFCEIGVNGRTDGRTTWIRKPLAVYCWRQNLKRTRKRKRQVWRFILLADDRGSVQVIVRSPWERVPYLSALEVCSPRDAIQINVHLYLYRYQTKHIYAGWELPGALGVEPPSYFINPPVNAPWSTPGVGHNPRQWQM